MMIHMIIVSHYHDDYLIDFLSVFLKSEKVKVYIKDNVNSHKLKEYCEDIPVTYIASDERLGFAANNNLVVEKIKKMTGFDFENDYYIFLNPDALIERDELKLLKKILVEQLPDLFTVDLFLDKNYENRDPSVRRFPRLIDFFLSFIFKINRTIVDRKNIDSISTIDWCAGSFLGVKCSVFDALGGFDESFFIYCEDIDFCYRANKHGYKLLYIPQVKAIHYAQKSSHNILSKNFFWHINSVIRLCRKHSFPFW